ncbi:ATP-dependent RNA helicase [Venturia nashicola]|uniref:ATP-dependent RNA helicase n=1 Tax=Venturia nashicola TaxID=86259 RepID=A0A4Z1P4Q9_9PEZI|nr:ATP-dependent RNA helicase [Venturia nashicola]
MTSADSLTQIKTGWSLRTLVDQMIRISDSIAVVGPQAYKMAMIFAGLGIRVAEARIIAAYDESATLKSDFLANMSNEIRTPMHGMLSANALLMDRNLSEEKRDLAEVIQESGQLAPFLSWRDIAHINHSIARGFQNTLKPNVKFELDLSPDLPKIIQGDPLRYWQVVQNLINNAGKFTEGGSIRL